MTGYCFYFWISYMIGYKSAVIEINLDRNDFPIYIDQASVKTMSEDCMSLELGKL